MLDTTQWAAYGRHWATVARLDAHTGRQAEAVQYFRLMYLSGECRGEDRAARARYPLCEHGRKTVVLREGKPLCSCETSK